MSVAVTCTSIDCPERTGGQCNAVEQLRYIKCYGCKNKIHVDHFAGCMKARNYRTIWFCDSLPCLLTMADKQKEIELLEAIAQGA